MSKFATQHSGLHARFFASADTTPQGPALEIDGQCWSYGQLRSRAGGMAAVLTGLVSPDRAGPMVGVLAQRSVTMYAGILGALACNGVVVPLNPSFPVERTAQMIELGGVDALVVDALGHKVLEPLLALLPRSLLLIVERAAVEGLTARWPNQRFVAAAAVDDFQPKPVSPEDQAYLFFTSGSTGIPKGVAVLHRNAARFVDMSMERYTSIGLGPTDRFSQFYDITFDSSMFDLFVCWAFGACLCCPTATEWVNPNKFIVARALTVIDIVPSAGHAMNRSNGWRPGRFPQLRLCRFGGEALTAELASTLAVAAPNAAIDNVYGPTECTVDATYYRWKRGNSEHDAVHGIVPIGVPGSQVGVRVIDAELAEVAMGADGELLISGPQVTPGYWKDPLKTGQSFIRLPGSDVVHYRTGDLVRRVAADMPIPYLGRIDYQIKIAGVRIELGEVEAALRRAAGTKMAVALGWPLSPSGAQGIVAFVEASQADGASIRRQLKDMLPPVMVPRAVHAIEHMPLNVNGKVDRKALLERLKEQASLA